METDADSDGREHRFQPVSALSSLCTPEEIVLLLWAYFPSVYLHRAKVTVSKLYLQNMMMAYGIEQRLFPLKNLIL